MDPLHCVDPAKDTTLAMIQQAMSRQWEVFYVLQENLFIRNGEPKALCQKIIADTNQSIGVSAEDQQAMSLTDFDVVLMRKDPPFDMNYVYATYLLELAEAQGVKVFNKPSSVRDANEKLFAAWWPDCCPETLVASRYDLLRDFAKEQKDVIIKPLDEMGGASIYRIKQGDENLSVILESMTAHQSKPIMMQRFIPDILTTGDKRILIINGKPVPHALARIPANGEIRANLAAGGGYQKAEFTKRDQMLCDQVGPTLKEKGLLFVGLDVIGDYITEINVTSPTCVRQIDALYGVDIMQQLFDEMAILMDEK